MTDADGAESAVVSPLATAPTYRISPGDTVTLSVLQRPGAAGTASVFLEVWEPGGAQPINSHPESVETFLFLRGTGRAESDGTVLDVGPGDLLILPAGSRHRIVNTGPGRLYAITTMVSDHGFCAFVERGMPASLDAADLEVMGVARR